MKALSTSYLLLLFLDGVLSVADSATETRLGLSRWTTVVLCLTSAFVFFVSLVLGFVVRFRPRWPLLVGSGLYATYFAFVLAAAFLGVKHFPPGAAQRR